MDKKKKLLALLSSANHPVTGKELSSRLNVSDRTIRNYIREINEEKLIIQSSSNGYWITVLIKGRLKVPSFMISRHKMNVFYI